MKNNLKRYAMFVGLFAFVFSIGLASAYVVNEYYPDAPFTRLGDTIQVTHHLYEDIPFGDAYREFIVDVNFDHGTDHVVVVKDDGSVKVDGNLCS